MKTNNLATALALSDTELLDRISALAGSEREVCTDLVAHLAALELRPSLYAAQGYGSLFAYCTECLRLSEDAACNRIAAARACRAFPIVLDLLAEGLLTLTSIRMLRPHLTLENHEAILARAAHGSKERIQALVAELDPKPDVAALVRRVPNRPPDVSSTAPVPVEAGALVLDPGVSGSGATADDPGTSGSDDMTWSLMPPPGPRPVVRALAPERYRVQFTIGQASYDKLRRLQALLRREIPNGDPGMIFEQFVDVLLDKVERAKLGGKAARPTYEKRIRSGTDKSRAQPTDVGATRSRHIPNAVKRAVWFRDRGQCAFVAPTGHRCTECSFLELHHIHPYALNGASTVGNISLRCRRHNQHEAELVFGGSGRAAIQAG